MMKIDPITTLIFVAFCVVGLAIWLSNHPTRTAKSVCESHLELVAGHTLRFQDDFSMHVTGGVSSGKVQVAFLREGELRTAECLLEWGEVKRLKMDGKEIPGR